MTITVSLKINDGLVLAADSASSMAMRDADGKVSIQNVFNNANKVFNLVKGLPIGATTRGQGNMGSASISTLVKELRRRLSGLDPNHLDWRVDPASYTVQAVAERLKAFMFDELYEPTFETWPQKPALGFVVAGYSSAGDMAEEFDVAVGPDGVCAGPTEIRSLDGCGVHFGGEVEALQRLIHGYSSQIPARLVQSGLPSEQLLNVLNSLSTLQAQLIWPAMPIQDAIELAEFMVDLTIKHSRFTPGAATVGGPIEIAVITKYEGFKWIKRKYYYSRDLNPKEDNGGATSTRDYPATDDAG